MSTLREQIERYALLALEKQDKFFRLAGEHLFELDLEKGLARFGRAIEFPCQVLGTQSDNTLTWLWAWSEAQEEIPETLLRSSREMRSWALRENVPEAAEPSVDLDRADGRALAMVAVEVCGASSFYRDPYEGGALYLLLFGRAIDDQAALTGQRMAYHVRELSRQYDISPRETLLAYFRAKGLQADFSGRTLSCLLESGEPFTMEFDAHGMPVEQE